MVFALHELVYVAENRPDACLMALCLLVRSVLEWPDECDPRDLAAAKAALIELEKYEINSVYSSWGFLNQESDTDFRLLHLFNRVTRRVTYHAFADEYELMQYTKRLQEKNHLDA